MRSVESKHEGCSQWQTGLRLEGPGLGHAMEIVRYGRELLVRTGPRHDQHPRRLTHRAKIQFYRISIRPDPDGSTRDFSAAAAAREIGQLTFSPGRRCPRS